MKGSRNDSLVLVFETAWGWCVARLEHETVTRFVLPQPREAALAAAKRVAEGSISKEVFSSSDAPHDIADKTGAQEAVRLVGQVRAWFDGRGRDFDLMLGWPGATGFQSRVWTELSKVPHGETVTYGELAARAGNPAAARAVGAAMKANPTPLLVPCHRVVAKNALGGFSAPGGTGMKQRMLLHESGAHNA